MKIPENQDPIFPKETLDEEFEHLQNAYHISSRNLILSTMNFIEDELNEIEEYENEILNGELKNIQFNAYRDGGSISISYELDGDEFEILFNADIEMRRDLERGRVADITFPYVFLISGNVNNGDWILFWNASSKKFQKIYNVLTEAAFLHEGEDYIREKMQKIMTE